MNENYRRGFIAATNTEWDRYKDLRFSMPICGLGHWFFWNADIEKEGLDPKIVTALETLESTKPSGSKVSLAYVPKELFKIIVTHTHWPPANVGQMIACEQAGIHPFVDLGDGTAIVGKVLESYLGEQEANDVVRAYFRANGCDESDQGREPAAEAGAAGVQPVLSAGSDDPKRAE